VHTCRKKAALKYSSVPQVCQQQALPASCYSLWTPQFYLKNQSHPASNFCPLHRESVHLQARRSRKQLTR